MTNRGVLYACGLHGTGLLRYLTVDRPQSTPRKYVFWGAILYFVGQRYTLTKLQNYKMSATFSRFRHRAWTTAKKAQNLERTL